ncbi:DUF1403 family protein [Rhizobiaceae bacterium n13]|uniref:DUF1403 family protein n=1 Tax=Ferirhizobium litorale TaxID=2927786 RepID=A0AAE3U3R8_9HYPH|nr:DUF1403 family protein [Fererhizobium litorale]MDI7862050.1 DUF1403 family protein [Fererhizobium litorale]MDI7922678.1 DUF1403 family protein [Fererhizobium litorale]
MMVRIAKSSAAKPAPSPAPPPFPAWARVRAAPQDVIDAAFASGAALAALHPIAISGDPLGQLWRKRLALKCAAAVVRLEGRKEDETELRDAWMLRRPGDDPGPAGHILDLWRRLGDRQALAPEKWAELLSGRLALPDEDVARTVFGDADRIAMGDASAVAAASAISVAVLRHRPEAEALALWLADAVLAIRLKWPAPVPLIAAHVRRSDLQAAARAPDEDPTWLRTCCYAYAKAAAEGFDLHADLARRAERLLSVAPKLRAKEAPNLVVTLMSEDALAAASVGRQMSDRSGRRFFDRLVSLGAVRELTGRPTFRLYGL